MLDWVLGKKTKRKGKAKKRPKGKRPSYEKAKDIAAHGSIEDRAHLASHEDLEPELLYYFATDKAAEVRRQVADNDGTPLQADVILANDVDDQVRCELARKIGRLIPNLSTDEADRLTQLALEVLEILAHDNLPLVRATISDEIKHADNVPQRVVKRLAEDVESIVAAPVLEYSPLLSGQDLMELISGGLEAEAMLALSRRIDLDESVAAALFVAHDDDAIASMLENKTARISKSTMEDIVDEAPEIPKWHKPIVNRDNLSVRIVRRVAGFVSAALVEILVERNNLDEKVVEEIRKSVRERIDKGEFAKEADEPPSAEERARTMHKKGELSEKVVCKGIDERDYAFVRYALVFMSGLPQTAVSKMLNTQSSKAATTLCWKCNLSMETCVLIQKTIARIKPNMIMKPAKDGGYPMEEEDLKWYVEYFTV